VASIATTRRPLPRATHRLIVSIRINLITPQ
jgi:hypothetical protein